MRRGGEHDGLEDVLEGRGADPMTLRTLQDWVVSPRLLQVPGVADVVSYGGLVREVHVEPDVSSARSISSTSFHPALVR